MWPKLISLILGSHRAPGSNVANLGYRCLMLKSPGYTTSPSGIGSDGKGRSFFSPKCVGSANELSNPPGNGGSQIRVSSIRTLWKNKRGFCLVKGGLAAKP